MTAPPTPSRLALFDLDHTLLPLDSDYQWSNFLAQTGRASSVEEIQAHNEIHTARYNRGELTPEESAAFTLGILALHTSYDLAAWHEEYMAHVIRPAITLPAVQLVQQHLYAGDLCAIVTATNHFIAAPIARAFGVPHLIATLPEYVAGRFTGRISGTPSFQAGKVVRTQAWLADLGFNLADFTETFFYSDSINDRPLLEIVNHPVATNPSAALRDLAQTQGWQVLNLFTHMKDEKS